MICPYCGNTAPWVSNEVVYGRRYGKSWMCYYCKPCDAYVGCHNNTEKPLGTMANKELRRMRVRCHGKIDPLWKNGTMKRNQLYQLIADAMQIDRDQMHVGSFDEQLCQQLLALNLNQIISKPL